MLENPQFSADLLTFTEEILNGKLCFLCIVQKIFIDFTILGVMALFYSNYLFL